jgi:Sulfotransferase family
VTSTLSSPDRRDQPSADPRLPAPIFIIGCNRSGTTLLFNNLSYHPRTWSLYVEAQDTFHRHYPVDPEQGEMVRQAPGENVAQAIRDELYARSHNKEAFKDTPLLRLVPRKALQRPIGRWYKPSVLRLVEKTPANSLRVPLLHAIFPDARFLFLVRRGEDVVSSLMEGWKNWSRTGERWHFTRWHYLVPPGWQAYRDKTLEAICAFQWASAMRLAWQDLQALPAGQVLLLRHEELMSRPEEEYDRVLRFCQLPRSRFFDDIIRKIEVRVYTTGGSRPRAEKWRTLHEKEITSIRDQLTPVNRLFYPEST